MCKYPNKSDKSGYVSLKEAYQWCNQSFFDGFTAALCETPEEFEALEVADRIAICMAAAEKCAILRRETPPQPDFIGGGYTVALIPYRLIQSLVACERGLRV